MDKSIVNECIKIQIKEEKMLKIVLKILIICFFMSQMLFAKTEAILTLDTQGHTGLIRDIVVTKSGDIISASDDKTIRVWDSKSGREKRKILGQIGSGSEGKIFAIALSDDEKYLASGGFLAGKKREDKTAIRIYNYHTGKLIKVLKSHSNVVLDLAFKDNYLISGSADNTAKIWDVDNDFKLIDTIKWHKNSVYATKIIKNSGSYYAVTAGYDNQIALYDMNKKRVINSHKLDYKLEYLAISPKLKNIAVCGYGKEIKIYDYNLNLIKTIYSDTVPTGLAYSPNGEYLIAGASAYPLNVNIYKTDGYRLFSSFKKHKNITVAVNFIMRGKSIIAVSAGGNNSEIYIWRFWKNHTKVLKKIVGVGSSVWSVGISGDNIVWGNKGRNIHDNDSWSIEKSINLKSFIVSDIHSKAGSNFNQISTTNGEYSLSISKGGDYGYSDAVLNIKKDGQIVAKIVKSAYDGYGNNCYGWYGDYIISAGSGGHINIYNKEGREIASLIGHTGDIWSMAIEGDRLVSGGSDQTIRVWNLGVLKSNIQKLKDNEELKIYPILNIFVSKDNDYIVWSRSGYFASSASGAKYVGYHINRGPDKEAIFVSSDRYFDKLYRPDIIEAIWEIGSEKKAITYVSRRKRIQKVEVSKSLPPVIRLYSSDTISTTRRSIKIRFSIESDSPITKIYVSVNGKKLDQRALKLKRKNSNIQTIIVPLDDGENVISLQARNRYAISDEVIINATKTTISNDIYKPTLYLLSIGVSKYKNSEYNLAFADIDAKSIVKTFKLQEHKLYKKVVTKLLTNNQANTDNILDALDWIEQEATSKDVVVIFIAGHGINDNKGNYYFVTYDTNIDKLRRTGLKWSEIEDTISSLPGKTILLVDTCHSGNILGSSQRRDLTGAIQSITNSGSGAVIMTATTGRGYSYEDPKWHHGAFTLSFIDGLGKLKADYNGDGVVTIKEIDLYITNRVKQLTKGAQKPTTIIPNSVPDFAIGVK